MRVHKGRYRNHMYGSKPMWQPTCVTGWICVKTCCRIDVPEESDIKSVDESPDAGARPQAATMLQQQEAAQMHAQQRDLIAFQPQERQQQ